MMRTRGKVLRVPSAGPGLIMIQGQQFKFSEKSVRDSEVSPQPGAVVNVELDRDLQVVAVTPVPDWELEKEEVEQANSERRDHSLRRIGFLDKLFEKLRTMAGVRKAEKKRSQ